MLRGELGVVVGMLVGGEEEGVVVEGEVFGVWDG